MTKEQLIIGIDGGSQSTKVSFFTTSGKLRSSASIPLKPLHYFGDGYVEHPDDDLWTSLVEATQQALAKLPNTSYSIIGIGLCTIRCCRALLDVHGKLVNPVMSWMDRRLQTPYEDTNTNVAYVTTSSGYITHKLTEQFKDTAANYEGQWPIDKQRWQWLSDPSTFKQFAIPKNKLFELVMPGEQLGILTAEAASQLGLASGIPVFATANDKAVEALGAGLTDEHTTLLSLGTYIAAMKTGDSLVAEHADYFCNMAAEPQVYLYESKGIRYGMSTVSWLRDLLNTERTHEFELSDEDLNRLAESVPIGSNGLVTIPEFLASPSKPFQRGCIVGLTAKHELGHLARSAFEGIALTMANNIHAMDKALNNATQHLIVSGGGANSDCLMQMIASANNCSAQRPKLTATAGLGAAVNAAVGLNVYGSYFDAQRAMTQPGDVFTPIAGEVERYQKLREVYLHASRYTDPLLTQLHHLS